MEVAFLLIGQRIQLALVKADKSQSDLARYLNTKSSTVAGWIREGRIPQADVILPICKFTDVSPTWLLSDDESEMRPFETKEMTVFEVSLMEAYKRRPEMQPAINMLLGLSEGLKESYRIVFESLSKYENIDDGIMKMMNSEIAKLEEAEGAK